MKKSHIATLIVLFVLIPLTLYLGSRLSGRSYYLTGTLIVIELLIPFFLAFEGRAPQARELVTIAVLCAIAVAGRAAIPIPNFKAIFAIIMIAGIAFGPETGFVVGAVSAFASNFFYGQGPYTPWQMLGYGVAGLIAGFVYQKKMAVQKTFGAGDIRLFLRRSGGWAASGYQQRVPYAAQDHLEIGFGTLYVRLPCQYRPRRRNFPDAVAAGETPS